MVRRLLMLSLALGPLAVVLDRVGVGDITLFVIAALALIPLAWIIGEATEHAAHHTGPGIGGLLNATFGNAPELIIALLAVNNGLPDVVRGSLTGSVVGNLLIVLGAALLVGGRGDLDRTSTRTSVALTGSAVVLFVVAAIPGFDGDPNRDGLEWLSLAVALVLLAVYAVVITLTIRRHRTLQASVDVEESSAVWTLRRSLIVLGAATVVTAFVSEVLVKTLETFAEAANLSEFVVAAVIVAIVGNAAEHGGAVVVAAKGKIALAAEIALSSAAQVAVFLIPAVVVLSFALTPLPLSFRPVELVALGGATVATAIAVGAGRSSRLRGAALLASYAAIVVMFVIAGDRSA